jgi:hypothetical protein
MGLEGLGSFERTKKEDMLLLVLNVAFGNLTIFNKMICFQDYLVT